MVKFLRILSSLGKKATKQYRDFDINVVYLEKMSLRAVSKALFVDIPAMFVDSLIRIYYYYYYF